MLVLVGVSSAHPHPSHPPTAHMLWGWLFPASFPRSPLSQEGGSAGEGLPIPCRAELSLQLWSFPWSWFCASVPQQETVTSLLAWYTLDSTSANTILLKLGFYLEYPSSL